MCLEKKHPAQPPYLCLSLGTRHNMLLTLTDLLGQVKNIFTDIQSQKTMGKIVVFGICAHNIWQGAF